MRKTQRRIVMDLAVFMRATRMARFGVGNKEIEATLGISPAQIQYRCKIYKDIARMKVSLRQLWRYGKDPFRDQILKDYAAVQDAEFEQKILPQIVIPTPKMVRVPERKAPTIPELMRQARRAA